MGSHDIREQCGAEEWELRRRNEWKSCVMAVIRDREIGKTKQQLQKEKRKNEKRDK
jgi:hypothetical protein